MPRRSHLASTRSAAAEKRLADVAEHLRRRGLKHSAVRDAVLGAFFGATGHLSLEELTRRARELAPSAAYSTVYRTMCLLVREGFAAERDFGGGRTLYEPVGSAHHDHLVCDDCGRIEEFEEPGIERLQLQVAAAHGFELRSHRLELHGLCGRCRDAS